MNEEKIKIGKPGALRLSLEKVKYIDFELEEYLEERVESVGSSQVIDIVQAFGSYKLRCGWTEEYTNTVERHVDRILSNLVSLPDIVIAIPSQREPLLNRTVETIRQDCRVQGGSINPLIIVFENLSDEALDPDEALVKTIHTAPDLYVLEGSLGESWNIGLARGLAVDISLALVSRLKSKGFIDGEKLPVIGSMDGDTVRFSREGNLQSVVQEFDSAAAKRQPLDCVVTNFNSAPELIAHNKTLYAKEIIRSVFKGIEHTILSPSKSVGTAGASTFYHPASLAAAGGIPPVSLGEDLLVGVSLDLMREGGANKIIRQDLGVHTDHSARIVSENITGNAYYDNWDANRRQSVDVIPEDSELDKLEVALFLLRNFFSILGRINSAKMEIKKGLKYRVAGNGSLVWGEGEDDLVKYSKVSRNLAYQLFAYLWKMLIEEGLPISDSPDDFYELAVSGVGHENISDVELTFAVKPFLQERLGQEQYEQLEQLFQQDSRLGGIEQTNALMDRASR